MILSIQYFCIFCYHILMKEMLVPNNIYCGDSTEMMFRIQESSIALSVWSPPYHVGKKYEEGQTYEEWKEMLKKVIKNHFFVLKPGGFLIINIEDILCFVDENMPRFQADIVSNKRVKISKEEILAMKKKHPNANRYELAKLCGCSEQTIQRRLEGNNIRGGKHSPQTRVKEVGGFLEEVAMEAGLYLYDRRIWVKDPAWANCEWTSNSLRSVDEFEYLYIFWKPGVTKINRNRLTSAEWSEWGSRGIWYIPSVRKNDDHEAKFPLELPLRCIRLFTEPGDIVLDPFIGSGTTAIAAIKAGRKYIGIDKEKCYVNLSLQNIAKNTR